MKGRCRSGSPSWFTGSRPKKSFSSCREPNTSRCVHSTPSHSHTGIGDPQKRLREIDQSRAFSSHLPNWPCLTFSGIQLICSFSSSIRSLIWVTSTYQEEIAR